MIFLYKTKIANITDLLLYINLIKKYSVVEFNTKIYLAVYEKVGKN